MTLIERMENDPSAIADIIVEYNKELEEIKQHLILRGKTLEAVNRDYPSWLFYAACKRTELKTLVDYWSVEVNRVRSKLFKSYTENYQIVLSDRAKDKYIDGEPTFISNNIILIEIKQLYDNFNDSVKTMEAVGYALNNITKARTADVHNVLL